MKITSPRLQTAHLSPNEEAILRAQTALELKDRGEYARALETMRPYWVSIGQKPDTKALYPSVAAEVLFAWEF